MQAGTAIQAGAAVQAGTAVQAGAARQAGTAGQAVSQGIYFLKVKIRNCPTERGQKEGKGREHKNVM